MGDDTLARDDRTPHCYPYPRPALTVDIVVLRPAQEPSQPPQILLIRRRHAPFAGLWALPGGFADEGEAPDVAARRELSEETGLTGVGQRQIGAFGAPGRDPRGWVVSIAYLVTTESDDAVPVAGDDAEDARWWSVEELPQLAFDHAAIISAALAPESRGR